MLEEELANYAHESWSNWMRYLFSKCVRNKFGCLEIPIDLENRWKRQMETHYFLLPEEEKESDRKEARKIIEIIKK